MCGDFNMTDNENDSPTASSYLTMRGDTLRAWEELLDTLCLREVPQDTHTHYFISTKVQDCRSSRIDRIYTTLRDADLLVITPSTFIPVTSGHSPQAEFARLLKKDGLKARAFKAHFISDHIPVGLSFTINAPSKKRDFNIPQWMGETDGFAARVHELWDRTGSAYGICAAWKVAVKAATKEVFNDIKKGAQDVRDDISFLSRAIAIIRACAARRQDKDYIESMLYKHKDMQTKVSMNEHGEFDAGALEQEVERLFDTELGKVGADLHNDEILPPLYLPGDGRGEDPIKAIKRRLPNSRAQLTHLKAKADDILTNDPVAMGDIIDLYYSEVWRFNSEGASEHEVWDYLSDYGVRVPEELQPPLPTPDDFADAINETNYSAAGPDGIPFSVYRAYLRFDPEFAKVLCDVSLEMASGAAPRRGYNHARLFLLPKKTGGLVADTRCISVTNGDNRINASVVAKLITPALQAVIHHALFKDTVFYYY